MLSHVYVQVFLTESETGVKKLDETIPAASWWYWMGDAA